jgi:chromosome segregation ATPase
MIEQMKVLEQQIQKLMEHVARLKEDKNRLEGKLADGEKALQAAREELNSFKEVEKEVRSRIERMLVDLKEVEDGGR